MTKQQIAGDGGGLRGGSPRAREAGSRRGAARANGYLITQSQSRSTIARTSTEDLENRARFVLEVVRAIGPRSPRLPPADEDHAQEFATRWRSSTSARRAIRLPNPSGVQVLVERVDAIHFPAGASSAPAQPRRLGPSVRTGQQLRPMSRPASGPSPFLLFNGIRADRARRVDRRLARSTRSGKNLRKRAIKTRSRCR